ncbi:MAG: hypothetical protein UHS49_00020 [Faecalimonas sp.]|nr:hypothetical protein [Faecalimonas sp.]
MKRKILTLILAVGVLASTLPGLGMTAEATVNTNSRTIGDANNTNGFCSDDLVRWKRYLSGSAANIEEIADMNLDGVYDEADVELCKQGLLTYTVDMKLAAKTTTDYVEAVNMKQSGDTVTITMKGLSKVWESASGSKVNVSIATAEGTTTESVTFHRVASEGTRDCTLTLPEGATGVTITGVEVPGYWSVPVK